MFLGLKNEHKDFQNEFAKYCKSYFENRTTAESESIWQSMLYSFDSGGKRFRPFLAYLVSKLYQVSPQKVMSIALAVELIHTYSLIHDDLPCMDNDAQRRGLPTNHIKFSEDLALLAGDALQAEAFRCLAYDSENSADLKIQVIQLCADLIGACGMVGGQVLDMASTKNMTCDQLENIHHKKTGDLITASILGAALFCQSPHMLQLQVFSKNLGLAFQIKDDLLDGLDGEQQHKSYLKILGFEQTNKKLQRHSSLALAALDEIAADTEVLKKMIQFNIDREK